MSKKIIFKNEQGKELKTNMSEDIMNRVSELIESDLKSKNIFYLREGTVFRVKQKDIENLLNAQIKANKKLIAGGVITLDMIEKDIDANF